jgi:alkylhydroperoxidase family enzyme
MDWFPLRDQLPEDVERRLKELGGRPINLYRALANQPDMLRAWVEFAWSLRERCSLPRSLRELVILRCAQMYGSEYEWEHHLVMARAAGVEEGQISGLGGWRESPELFDAGERAALALAEAVFDGDVGRSVSEELERCFPDPGDRVELVLTAATYTMVPRVLEALGVPLETS